MIKIEHTEVYGWGPAIRGMRNPKNSWDKSDSGPFVGDNDLALMKALAKAGTDHGKFMRMIVVYCDITAPLYWYKEMDTYRMGVEKNSCSTMHKIHAKELTLEDFSHEHLRVAAKNVLTNTIKALNAERAGFIGEGLEPLKGDKQCWYSMIQLLPSSYNQRRTYMFSYAALRNMYHARKNHKLDEWREFCEWVETLPYSSLITDRED